jgi:transposase-like protein
VVSYAVVIATGVAVDGPGGARGFAVGASEDGAFSTASLDTLRARGWTGTQLLMPTTPARLNAATSAVLLGAARRPCPRGHRA